MTAMISDFPAGRAAAAGLRPVADVPGAYRVCMVAAFLLGTMARDALGDPDAAVCALQHHIAGATLISETADLLARASRPASPPARPARHLDALTHGETRVLHYLPTNLSAREIASELYLSVNTVKTHQRHLYQKLGARSRTQAVKQARALGLLAPPARTANRKSQARVRPAGMPASGW
jgi:LuxR family transcriptional regulator, maltose regulon positive regulatory protein